MQGSTKILAAVLAAPALAALAMAPAFAHGPSDSHEEEVVVDGETGEETTVWDNEVTCPGTDDTDPSDGGITIVTPLGVVFVGAPNPMNVPTDLDLGVELCSDGTDSLPADGRVIVGLGGGDLTNPDPGNQPIGAAVIADGDASNGEEGSPATSWARLDLNTRDGLVVRCGDSEGNQDATHPNPTLPDQPESNEPADGQDGMEDCG